jgi:hypothetical protein
MNESHASAAEPFYELGEIFMRAKRVGSRIGVLLVGIVVVALTGGAALAGGSANGAASQRPVFYEGRLVTVNMFEVPAADGSLLEENPGINTIYASNDLDEEQDFRSVIDAIPTEGFNPLWHQVLIVFNPGSVPHQFVSEAQILAAAAGAHPEITLVSTDEVYRCSVVSSH